jgi:carboxylesterase type B
MEHDIILVTGNYRLGPMGFLSFEDKECSGNFGLKDQVMILQWVKKNIDKFGQSAGEIFSILNYFNPFSPPLRPPVIV